MRTLAEKQEAAENERRAVLALRLLESEIPEGARGRIYRRPEGWFVDYGGGAEVDLPDVDKERLLSIINDEMGLPFAWFCPGKELSGMPPQRDDLLSSPAKTRPAPYATWRRGRNTGEWMLFGPEAVLRDRQSPIQVLKSDGTFEKRRVLWISRPFLVDGVSYCYARPVQNRTCIACGAYHTMDEVRGLYAGGTMHTGAYWRPNDETCSCGGHLASE